MRHAFPLETRFFLILSAAVLILTGAAPLLPDFVPLLALAVGVAVFGVPHGAADPLVAQAQGLWRTPLGFVLFNAAYVALALVVIALWIAAPAVSLAAFLVIAAWHFGGDWAPPFAVLERAAAGAALLCLPAFAAPDAAAQIYAVIAGEGARAVVPVQAAAAPWCLALAGFAAIRHGRAAPSHAVELALIAALAFVLPPLLFFTAYFCGLHSPRHLRGLWQRLSPLGAARLRSWVIGYTALTLALAVGAFALLPQAAAFDARLLQIVFVGLAALTVPHMVLVDGAPLWRRIAPAAPAPQMRRSHGV